MSIEILNVAKIFICFVVICFEICIFDILNTIERDCDWRSTQL